MVNPENRKMSDQQIDTIILAAFAAKQKVTITFFDGSKVSGFVHSDFDVDGFSLTSTYIWWKDIQFVEPNSEFFVEWSDILSKTSDPFSTGRVDD